VDGDLTPAEYTAFVHNLMKTADKQLTKAGVN
jgi:hypothetical protein